MAALFRAENIPEELFPSEGDVLTDMEQESPYFLLEDDNQGDGPHGYKTTEYFGQQTHFHLLNDQVDPVEQTNSYQDIYRNRTLDQTIDIVDNDCYEYDIDKILEPEAT